ncbi:MAG TPA: PucR family transcriptional regulator [Firmicutes bacterium]|nr:PucR family transcriptional regulator [Bacillota bacterium]
MQLTVGEALGLNPLNLARVIAGEAGLSNAIESVTVVDAPDAVEWLRGGELVLTTAYSIKDDPGAQLAFVRNLVLKKASALGIKLRRFVDALPAEVLSYADEVGLPILEIPYELAWIDVINPMLSEILDRQASVLRRSFEIHTQFIDAVLKGAGLPSIADVLASQVRTPVAIVDTEWNLLAQTNRAGDPDEPAAVCWDEEVERLKAGKPVELSLKDGSIPSNVYRISSETSDGQVRTFIVTEVRTDNAHYGRVIALEPTRRALSRVDVLAIQHAATGAALETLKAKAAAEVERRFRSSFWQDVVNSRFQNREALIQRARALGWNFATPHILLMVSLDSRDVVSQNPRAENTVDIVRDRILRVVGLTRSSNDSCGHGMLCFDDGSGMVVLVPVDRNTDAIRAKETAMEIAHSIKKAVNSEIAPMTVSVGIGRFYPDVLELARSYREARECVGLGRALFGDNSVIHFDDLGLYRLLSRASDPKELETFISEQIGRLVEYDRLHHTQLLTSLEEYIASNGNIRAAAAAMHVHINTMKYRLRRLEKVLGVDLRSHEVCFNLELALKLRRYVQLFS